MLNLVLLPLVLTCLSLFCLKASNAQPPLPPKWPDTWMGIGSGFYLFSNETISAQIYYDWTVPAQVMNLMRADSIVFTIFHIKDTVWRLERANKSCCIDPQQTGVSPPRPDWLQIGNQTVYDGIETVMEHDCHSWTKNVPDVAQFSWLISVSTSIPCRLKWLEAVHFDFSYYSANSRMMPSNIFTVPDYCPLKVTDPNCSIMHF